MLMFVFVSACADHSSDTSSLYSSGHMTIDQVEPWATSVYEIAKDGSAGREGTDLIDYYSNYVHTNTTHLSGTSYYKGKDVLGMFRYLNDFLTGKISEIRSFQCGDRAHVLRILLVKAGMQARLVNIASDWWDDKLHGHILVEVLNPDTQVWELIDPDFGVHYGDGARRVGLIEAVTKGPSGFQPCKDAVCDWRHADVLRKYDYFQFGLQQRSEHQPGLLNLSYRFNRTKVFSISNKTVIEMFSRRFMIVFR